MTRQAVRVRRVAPGGLEAKEDAAYGAGYWEGWWDIHLTTRRRRGCKRQRSADYASGYQARRIDGTGHPYCAEWDLAHRKGRLADLPQWCPWRPSTAAITPTWEPVAATTMDLADFDVSIRHLRQRADILPPGPVPSVLSDRRPRGTQGDGR